MTAPVVNNVGEKSEDKHSHGEEDEPERLDQLGDGTAPEEVKKKKKKAGKSTNDKDIFKDVLVWLVPRAVYLLQFCMFILLPVFISTFCLAWV